VQERDVAPTLPQQVRPGQPRRVDGYRFGRDGRAHSSILGPRRHSGERRAPGIVQIGELTPAAEQLLR
jgi:hypothetical protein